MRRAAVVGVALVALLACQGCAFLGPIGIKGSRLAYNDTIVATNNQQVLALLVRMRYGESSGLLAVNSITSNMKVAANAGSEFGYGKKSNYQGNLVPLSIGFAYEENPTISYTPVEGEKYMRQLLSPLPLDLTVLLLNAMRAAPQGMTLLLRSVNGIRNPDFLADETDTGDGRFARLVELLVTLGREGRLTWAEEAGEKPIFVLAIKGKGETVAARVTELSELLGFEAPRARGGVVILPTRLGLGEPSTASIHLETRSLFDLLSVVAAAVEVPAEHAASGFAPPLRPLGAGSQILRIHSGEDCPDGAAVAVEHHDACFFIDGTDTQSKLAFRIVESLISVRVADTAGRGQAEPVLTVPVAN